MYSIKTTKQFKTDFKKLNQQEQKDVQEIVNQLKRGQTTAKKSRPSFKRKLTEFNRLSRKLDLILIYSKEEQLSALQKKYCKYF